MLNKNGKTYRDVDYYHLLTKNLIPVALAGVIDRMIFHPMETVITLQQDSGYSARTIIKELYFQGVKSFYPGYWQNIMAAIPIRMSIFSTYSFIKTQGSYTSYPLISIQLFAGFVTGFLESTILCPVDAYRTRKTLVSTKNEKFHFSYMFKGYAPLLARTSIENSICLVGSDFLLGMIPMWSNSPLAPYFSGLIAGFVSQYFSVPFDVVKTRCMKEPDKKLVFNLRKLISERGLFRSVGLKATRAGICNSMMIGTSNYIANEIEEYEGKLRIK